MLLALSSFAWPLLKPASYYRDLPPTPVMLCFVQFPFFFLVTYAARAILLELADACYERAEKGERPARP